MSAATGLEIVIALSFLYLIFSIAISRIIFLQSDGP
jgi:hypothetical protein